MRRLQIEKKAECCGCMACSQVCPQHSITMTTDEEGFWYPQVDTEKCTDCGLCRSVCPMLERPICGDGSDVSVYIAYTRDVKARAHSSSGGMFTMLAQPILETGGVVFGAAFDAEGMAHHIAVTSVDGLDAIRRSKYVQSRIENTYAETEKYLRQGKRVLFSGTTCQIAGLLNYLGQPYEHLYTVDLICHGVPSPLMCRHYYDNLRSEYNSAIKEISDRYKKEGLEWRKQNKRVCFENGVVYCKSASEDAFYRMFLADICLRPSCYECRFRGMPRESDITIGDCWGIERHSPEMDDDGGTSVVIVSSTKGQRMWDACAGGCVWKKSNVQTVFADGVNATVWRSQPAHPNREKFFAALRDGAPIQELVDLTDFDLPFVRAVPEYAADFLTWYRTLEKDDPAIYIYGIGRVGKAVLTELRTASPEIAVRSFLITNPERKPTEVDGIPVRGISDANMDPSAVVLIAALPRYQDEIAETLRANGCGRVWRLGSGEE